MDDERTPTGRTPDAEFAPPELRARIARTPDDDGSPEPPRADRRAGGQRRVAWAGARARNALRRPVRLGVVAGIVFAASLLTLILVPRQAQQAFARLAPRPDEWRDTAAALAVVERRAAEHEAARRAFLAARVAATTPVAAPAPPPFVPTPEQLARRDSLTTALGALQRGLARVERSPLPASYRALGELPELAAEPRVVALLDSLAAVEREREEFAALGGVDPVYVALTTRLNAIGRAIQEVAAAQAATATAGLDALRPPPPPPTPVAVRPDVDTLGPLNRVVATEQALLAARQRVEGDRQVNGALAARARSAQQAANFVAPPGAILAAAIVLALVAGYTAALVAELRDPRVADAAEIERETGRRALAVVRPSEPIPERTRRRADERTPDLIDPSDDAYHLLYLHISPTGAALPVVTVTGMEPAVVAAVAANLAAAAAQDARTPLLVDADLEAGLVAGALRVRPAPGVNELLRGEAAWSEVVGSAMFGRERTVDVIPAGMPAPDARGRPEPDDAFRRDLLRVSRRYDLTVVAAPLEHAARGARSVLPAPDVVLCVRAAVTRLRDVRAAVDSLQGAGLRVQGVVIWDDALPSLTPTSAAEWRARARVEEARREAAREAAAAG